MPLWPARGSTARESVPPSRCWPLAAVPFRLKGIFTPRRRAGRARPSLGSVKFRNGFTRAARVVAHDDDVGGDDQRVTGKLPVWARQP